MLRIITSLYAEWLKINVNAKGELSSNLTDQRSSVVADTSTVSSYVPTMTLLSATSTRVMTVFIVMVDFYCTAILSVISFAFRKYIPFA